ncbi:hypothetical protein Hypma_007246 [Hypsizygus marmoreus]|uniref:Uncharacterized protein n=1 Tax=Hypsizygus marmoreus TaxID=39966 RepID=A0A369K8S9_HYPMA|nr:hypothetical protein Hypma_007246 [Hypsizygus marmoreus]
MFGDLSTHQGITSYPQVARRIATIYSLKYTLTTRGAWPHSVRHARGALFPLWSIVLAPPSLDRPTSHSKMIIETTCGDYTIALSPYQIMRKSIL